MNYIETLKSLPIEQVIEKFAPLDGKSIIKCPFPDHNDTHPSFKIYSKANSFFCFGCNRGGDVIRFTMLMQNKSFWESCEYLSKEFNIPLPSWSSKEKAKFRLKIESQLKDERFQLKQTIKEYEDIYNNPDCTKEEKEFFLYLINEIKKKLESLQPPLTPLKTNLPDAPVSEFILIP